MVDVKKMGDINYESYKELLTFIPALLIIINSYILEKRKWKRQVSHETQKKFKACFSSCITKLSTSVTGPSISEQIGITKEFLSSLSYPKRRKFQRIWQKYYPFPLDDVLDEKTRDFLLLDYMSNTKEQEIEIRKKLIRHFEDLLKFAN